MTNGRIKNDQKGMVAIVTTMILMIVISLIIVGFSQVARRNQRQALDAQLSSQAFYAAESGINLAKKAIKDDPTLTYAKSSCGTDSTITNYQVDGTDNVAITCLLVSPVNNLVFDNIGATSKVSLIQPQAGSIDTIYINWESTSSGDITGCTAAGSPLPQAGANWNCNQPLLRVDMVPLPNSLDLNTLRDSQYTAFLYPTISGTSNTTWAASAGASNRGNIVKTTCNNSPSGDQVRKCMIQINSIPSTNRFGIRMMSLYGDAKVEIHAKGGGIQPNLAGAQVLVDSTAKANDVLKRVQARVSTLNSSVVPDFAIASNDLCKRYLVDTSTNKVSIDGGAPAQATTACQL